MKEEDCGPPRRVLGGANGSLGDGEGRGVEFEQRIRPPFLSDTTGGLITSAYGPQPGKSL